MDINRREFLATVAAAQGAFVLGFWMPQKVDAQTVPRRRLVRGARDAGNQRLDRDRAG